MRVVDTAEAPMVGPNSESCVMGMSITQIIIGALCILLQIILIASSPLHYYSQGIWTGLIFILAGSFGVISCRKKTPCFIMTFLALSIISVGTTLGIFYFSTGEISFIGTGEIPFNGTGQISYSRCLENNIDNDGKLCLPKYRVIGINAVLLAMAALQVVMAIISVSCYGLSSGNRRKQMAILPFTEKGAAAIILKTPPPPHAPGAKIHIPE